MKSKSTSKITNFMHDIPKDLNSILKSNKQLIKKWEALTPIAQNEWICWLTIVKKEETRAKHLERLQVEILDGEKRPCCWYGCPHRNPNSAKWVTKKV